MYEHGRVDARSRNGSRPYSSCSPARRPWTRSRARLGVHASTVEGWRQDALAGVEQALRRGSGKTAAEFELERKQRHLEKVVTTLSIQKCLLEQALETEREKRPTGPARSKR
jgi:hypothetical protein